jgi:PAS domain-containing protein
LPHLLKKPPVISSLAGIGSVAIALIVAIFSFFFIQFLAREDASSAIARRYDETEHLFKAAIDPRFQSKAEEIDRVANRLVVIDVVKGGALFDDSGHLLESFGEATETGFVRIGRTADYIFAVEDPARIEYYLSPGVTGTPYHLIARVDMSDLNRLQERALERVTVIAVTLSGVVFLLLSSAMIYLVVLPSRKIISAIDAAVADPANADTGPPLIMRRTELGMIAGRVEHFRAMLGKVWRTKVMVADSILENSPFAIVQLTPDGSPIFANPAAVEFFERDIIRGDPNTPILLRDAETDQRGTLMELLKQANGTTRLFEPLGTGRQHYALATSLSIGVTGRAPDTIALLTDVTTMEAARQDYERRFRNEAALVGTGKRREFELKLMLESCLTLLSGPDKPQPINLDSAPYITEWLKDAKTIGIVASSHNLGDNPMVSAAPDDLRAVCRLALLVAYSRTGRVPVQIMVDSKGINFETVGLAVKAVSVPSNGDDANEATAADWQLAFAALRTALRRINGQLAEFTATHDHTVVKLILKGAAERMHTTLKGRA